jgi:glycosyltransferase involved in cell wall biosynthesis
LQVIARLAVERPDVRLLIAGRLRWDGDDLRSRRMTMRRAQELGIANRIEFVGPYTQADAPSLYRRADLLLHSKYNDPCPAVVLEGMASGLPVVYSASGGVPELVGDAGGIGVPALLDWECDHPPDPDAMVAAVRRAVAATRELGAAARARAVERFDTKHWVCRHQKVFESLVR